jgi:hypothetical protein
MHSHKNSYSDPPRLHELVPLRRGAGQAGGVHARVAALQLDVVQEHAEGRTVRGRSRKGEQHSSYLCTHSHLFTRLFANRSLKSTRTM